MVLALGFAGACHPEARELTEKDAERLVMNVPRVLKAKETGRQPRAERIELGDESHIAFQVRSTRISAASGMIGNFWVNIRTGEVYSDIDKTKRVDSPRIRRLRREFFASRVEPKAEPK